MNCLQKPSGSCSGIPTGHKGQKRSADVRVVRKTAGKIDAGGKISSAVRKLHAESAKRWAIVYQALAKKYVSQVRRRGKTFQTSH